MRSSIAALIVIIVCRLLNDFCFSTFSCTAIYSLIDISSFVSCWAGLAILPSLFYLRSYLSLLSGAAPIMKTFSRVLIGRLSFWGLQSLNTLIGIPQWGVSCFLIIVVTISGVMLYCICIYTYKSNFLYAKTLNTMSMKNLIL